VPAIYCFVRAEPQRPDVKIEPAHQIGAGQVASVSRGSASNGLSNSDDSIMIFIQRFFPVRPLQLAACASAGFNLTMRLCGPVAAGT
jgi:hypothetical protein